MALSCNVFEQLHEYLRGNYLVMKAFIGFGFIRRITGLLGIHFTSHSSHILYWGEHDSTYLGKGYKYTFLVLTIDYIEFKF